MSGRHPLSQLTSAIESQARPPAVPRGGGISAGSPAVPPAPALITSGPKSASNTHVFPGRGSWGDGEHVPCCEHNLIRDARESLTRPRIAPPRELLPGSGSQPEPCGFEPTYQELASAVKEEYPDIEIESRLGGTGAFEIEINGQLVFSKLENGGFPYEKDLIEAIRRARNGEPLEKITNSRPPCVIL
uniref:Migration and invasion enhancer 1 n=1 Tax=Dromaius novaehollandiae TaxID=8790 RepID=A0A8C4JDZ6_DRONO